jgi:DNA-binding MarR family transcriptional regulator
MASSTKYTASPKVLTDLMSHRLHQLASLSALSASLRYERKYQITLLEWRSIGMLAGYAPLSLKELARRAGLDKSYASRTIAGLIERGLVISERDDNDGRGVNLRLSEAGQALFEKVFPDAVERNERMLSMLKPEQRERLVELLSLLQLGARRLLDEERRASAGEVPQDDEVVARPAGTLAPRSAKAALDVEELRYLVARLSELVGSPST